MWTTTTSWWKTLFIFFILFSAITTTTLSFAEECSLPLLGSGECTVPVSLQGIVLGLDEDALSLNVQVVFEYTDDEETDDVVIQYDMGVLALVLGADGTYLITGERVSSPAAKNTFGLLYALLGLFVLVFQRKMNKLSFLLIVLVLILGTIPVVEMQKPDCLLRILLPRLPFFVSLRNGIQARNSNPFVFSYSCGPGCVAFSFPCPAGLWANTQTFPLRCSSCLSHPNCASADATGNCTSGGLRACNACKTGYYKNSESGVCTGCVKQDACSTSFLSADCVGDKIPCRFCKTGFDLQDGLCVPVATGCTPQANCRASDLTQPCVGEDMQYCSSCSNGFYLSDGLCYSCVLPLGCISPSYSEPCDADNFYYCGGCLSNLRLEDGECVACHSQPSCLVSDTVRACFDEQYYCLTCAPGTTGNGGVCQACTEQANCLTSDVHAVCVGTNYYCSVCDSGYSPNSAGICVPCAAQPGCGLIDTISPCVSGKVACSICMENGFYMTPTAGLCRACDPQPTCTLANPNVPCVGAVLNQYSCITCQSGMFPDDNGVCVACNKGPGCLATEAGTCVGSGYLPCTACATGYYLSGNLCIACTALPGCDNLECTTDDDETCQNECSAGYYGQECEECSDVPNCQDGHVICTNDEDQICTACDEGYYSSSPTSCVACSYISHCGGNKTCSTATDQKCEICSDGYYGPLCQECINSPGCTANTYGVPCTGKNGVYKPCTACSASYFLNKDVCTPCTSIRGCSPGSLTCTNATDQSCAGCTVGYYRNDTSGPCTPCLHPPNCLASVPGVTCLVGPGDTLATYKPCSSCLDGFYFEGDWCTDCSPLDNCTNVVCTTDSDSTCAGCPSGTIFSNSSCLPCSLPTDCQNYDGGAPCIGGDLKCVTCIDGHYLSGNACPACTSIALCDIDESYCVGSKLACKTCADGYFYKDDTNTCEACTSQANCDSGEDDFFAPCVPLFTNSPACTPTLTGLANLLACSICLPPYNTSSDGQCYNACETLD